jgi:hypothetical protein
LLAGEAGERIRQFLNNHPLARRTGLPAAFTLMAGLACLLVLVGGSAGAAVKGNCPGTGHESVQTNKSDYPPGGTAQISGSGYAPGCDAVVRVTLPNGSVVTGDGTDTPGSDVVTTDGSGGFTYEYVVTGGHGTYAVDVIGRKNTVLASTTFTDAFGISTLRLGSASGPEDYLYTAGDVIFPRASVDANKYYRFVIKDSGGTQQGSVACTSTNSLSATNNTFTVQSDDPVSTGTSWSFTLQQFDNSSCSGTPAKTDSLYFDVARATSFEDTALTIPRSVFNASATAYVRVDGVGKVKDSSTNVAKSDWATTWLLPSGGTACANTGGSDRPDSTAGGRLPATAGSFLQYRPNTTGTGDAWNRQSNYETRPGAGSTCIGYSSSSSGQWKLKVQLDNQHFVTLDAFKLDASEPISSAAAPAFTNSTSIQVDYTASDPGPAGLAQVELWAKAPDAGSFSKVATDSTPSTSGEHFDYTASAGEGTYRFYTIAVDQAGNVEVVPGSEDAATVLDSTDPTIDVSLSPASPDGSGGFYKSQPTVHVSAADDNLDSVSCTVDGSAVSLTDTDPSATAFEADVLSGGDGSHTAECQAADKAGQERTDSETYNVDATDPTVDVTFDPSSPDGFYSSLPTVHVSAHDANLDAVTCKVDGSDATLSDTDPSAAGFESEVPASSSDGSHTVDCKATDLAGREHTGSASYKIDAAAKIETLSFTPEADTYVSSSSPDSIFGSATSMTVDASPTKQAFLRFDLSGIEGRAVLDARLRLNNRDLSPDGGRVWGISSNSWTESATTWNTRPTIDGSQLGSFGAVEAGNWYEATLDPSFLTGDGTYSLAMDSANTDGAGYSTREGSTPPELLVDVDMGLTVHDGLSEVAAPTAGSSDPTNLSTNKRIAVTSGGRTLVVHGRHAQGVQLAWRDRRATGWHRQTTGAVSDGLLLGGTGTGDWPASIALSRDSAGEEHAWVVWGRQSYTYLKPVQMVRLSNLDDPSGPTVGPTIDVDAAPQGGYRPDVAFESIPGGGTRGVVIWGRRSGDTLWELHTAWFTDLDSDTPAIHDDSVLVSDTTYKRWGTLVPTAAGMRAVVKGASGRLRVFAHDASDSLTSWTSGPAGVSAPADDPAAVALDSGEILAAAETDTTNHVLVVQRFSPSGVPASPELELTGYTQPTLATDGTNAWLVMVRKSDGFVISRQLTAGSGWSTTDRVEIGAEGGGNYASPNAVRRTDGRLRFVVRGPAGAATKSAVLEFQRLL